MKTLTVRLEDQLHEELVSIARARGVTLSDLAREQLHSLTIKSDSTSTAAWGSDVPSTLPVAVRHQLALLHRILAHLVDGSGEDGDRDYQLQRAKVLERGYVVEYSEEFLSIEPELSESESVFVMDVLDMFERLEESYTYLSEGERESLGSYAEHTVRFRGFDLNSRLESRLLAYARHLISDGRWTRLATYFDRQHESGNSHMPMYDTYVRMVEVFLPIWKQKLRDGAGIPEAYRLDAGELAKVIGAAIHPSNRRP